MASKPDMLSILAAECPSYEWRSFGAGWVGHADAVHLMVRRTKGGVWEVLRIESGAVLQ